MPGEHDTTDPGAAQYFARFGKASNNKGYYSFDHAGVHFMALVNVMDFKPGGLGTLGDEQLAWAHCGSQASRGEHTHRGVRAHAAVDHLRALGLGHGRCRRRCWHELKRFGSVTVLNGHIHQIVQKVEGNITFHTARSTAFPQPVGGEAAGPGPLKVPPERLRQMLGLTTVSMIEHSRSLAMVDSTLGGVE